MNAVLHNRGIGLSLTELVELLCVNVSSFYSWQKRIAQRKEAERSISAQELEVIKIFELSRKTYGSRRVLEELKARGRKDISYQAVRRIMRKNRLKSVYCHRSGQKVIATDSRKTKRIAENKLNRNFEAERPNEKWCGDTTYIKTWEGVLYLTTVIDLFSRKLVGYALSKHNDAKLACEAFKMALLRRKMPRELLFHSDRGTPYGSDEFIMLLASSGITPSMSRKADCLDNSVAECFNKILKVELVYRQIYRTQHDAVCAVQDWVENFYNPVRLHSSLGYKSPDRFELEHQKNVLI
jgi:transposase InsO family protein